MPSGACDAFLSYFISKFGSFARGLCTQVRVADTISHAQELLELGETVGTQSRGLSQEQISLLPISKYKRGLFSRRRSRDERYKSMSFSLVFLF